MARIQRFRIETRQAGEPWRRLWEGTGEEVAVQAAKALASETRIVGRTPSGEIAIAVHPHIRVLMGKLVIFSINPETRTGERVVFDEAVRE